MPRVARRAPVPPSVVSGVSSRRRSADVDQDVSDQPALATSQLSELTHDPLT